MCIHPPLALKLKQIFKNMKIERNKQCKGECSNDHFQTYADPDCVIITDSLMINGNASQPVLSALKNVEEIRGVLEVANTNITDFNYLPKLTKLNTANYSKSSDLLPTTVIFFSRRSHHPCSLQSAVDGL